MRFREGEIDWEVVEAKPHELFPGIQRIALESGMTGVRRFTSNEHIIHRNELYL